MFDNVPYHKKRKAIFADDHYPKAIALVLGDTKESAELLRKIAVMDRHWPGISVVLSRFAAAMMGFLDADGELLARKVILQAVDDYSDSPHAWKPYGDRVRIRRLMQLVFSYEPQWQSMQVMIAGKTYNHDELLYDFLAESGVEMKAMLDVPVRVAEEPCGNSLVSLIVPGHWQALHMDWMLGESGEIYEEVCEKCSSHSV